MPVPSGSYQCIIRGLKVDTQRLINMLQWISVRSDPAARRGHPHKVHRANRGIPIMHYRFLKSNSTSYLTTEPIVRPDRRSRVLRNALLLLAALYSVNSLGSSPMSSSLLAQTQPPSLQPEAKTLPPPLPEIQPAGTEEAPKDDPIFQKILEAIQESPPSLSAPPISTPSSAKSPGGVSEGLSSDADPFSELANLPADVAKQISDEATWELVDSLLRSSKLLMKLSQQSRRAGDMASARRMESLALRMRREIVLLLHPPTSGSNLQGDGIQPLEESLPTAASSSKAP